MTIDTTHQPRHAGFTYLWVLFLVAFMGLGLSIASAISVTVIQRDRERALIAIGHQFRIAIGRYAESGALGDQRDYPASLDDLLKDNRTPGVTRHLRKVFIDPMTRKAEWGLLRINGRIVGVHSLSDAQPIKQTGFETIDMSFSNRQKYSDWVFSYPADLMTQIEAGADATLVLTQPAETAEGQPADRGAQ